MILSFILSWFVSISIAEPVRFDRLADSFFSDSQQSEMVRQDRNRLFLEYQIAVGSFYDPVLRAGYFSDFTGNYLNRRSDISVLQRTPFWGTQLQIGYRFGRGSFPIYDGKWITQNDGEVRFGIEIPLLRNGSTDTFRTSIDKGDLSKKLSSIQEKSQNLNLLQQLGVRYWDWFTQGKRLEVFRKLLILAESRQVQISKRVSHGDLAKIEEIEGERTILQRKSQLAQQERLFVKSRLDLKTFVLDRKISDSVEFLLEDVPVLKMVAQPINLTSFEMETSKELEYVVSHPEVQRQNIILEQSKLDEILARNQFLPKLDVQLVGSRDLGPAVYSFNKVNGEAGLVFEFPIPSRGASGRIEQTTASVIRQESQFELTKIKILNSIKESQNALTTSVTRLNYSFGELDLAKKLAEMESKRFLGGDSNLLLLNIREQNLAEAEIRKYEAFSDYQKALNDYHVSIGFLKWSVSYE